MTKMPVFFDLETFSFEPGCMAPQPVVCSWAFPDEQKGLMPMWEQGSWDVIEGWIDRAIAGEVVLAGHHIAYDTACLFANAKAPRRIGRKLFDAYQADGIQDTAVRQKLLDIKDGTYRGFYHDAAGAHKISYHLADLVPRLCKRPLPKPQGVRTSYEDVYGVPLAQWPKDYVDYAQDDAVAVRDVYREQEALAAKTQGVLEDEHRQSRASFALQLASNWGPICDPAAVDALEASAKEKVRELMAELRKSGLVRSNGTKNMSAAQHAMALACDSEGIEIPRTPSGGVCVNEDACTAVRNDTIQAWAAFNKVQNILSKDIPLLRRGCGQPIHSYFEECVESGRTSSSNPNIQNIKRAGGFRECFMPRPGHLFALCDFGKAELHSLAEACHQLFGYSVLGDALNKGIDPHLAIAASMLKLPYDEVVRRADEPQIKQARQAGKSVNFGLPGGLGVEHFRVWAKAEYGVDMSAEEAQKAKDTWFETWPEVKEYLAWVARAVGQSETTITQLFSGRMRGGCGYTDGSNTIFQGLTADYAKASLFNVAREQYVEPTSALYGCRTINFIHDEIIAEVPEDVDLADAAARRLQQVMEETSAPWTPHAPVKAEALLATCWSKKAKRVLDEQGRIVSWRPR